MGLRTASNPSAGSSSQGTNSRTSPIPLAWSVALRASRDITIQAAVEYVVCLAILTLFICLVPGLDESVSISTSRTSQIWTKRFPLGYWRNLWSSLDFADQPLKSCVSVIHNDIVEIWNLYDKTKVSSSQLPCCVNC